MKTFSELSREDKLKLMEAWVDGMEIQCGGEVVKYPEWLPGVCYEIVPQMPQINWDHVSDRWNWLAMDDDGDHWLFESKPTFNRDHWLGGVYIVADDFASFKKGTASAKDSLVGRGASDDYMD